MKNAFMLVVLSVLGSIGLVLAQGIDGYCGMGGMMYGAYGGGMMAFGWLFSTLVLVVLILLIIWLVKQIQKK